MASALRTEERWLESGQPDPVFLGMVEDFKAFDEVLQTWSEKLEIFVRGVQELSLGVQSLSEGLAEELKRQDRAFLSEGCRFREAAQEISRRDAPHSVIARFERNVEFNMSNPLKDHLDNHAKLRKDLEKRELCLTAVQDALKQVELCEELTEADLRKRLAKDEFRASKATFNKVNRSIFHWLYVLEEHRGDIIDSCLQTVKYLQYDFFSSAAHAVSHVLPQQMSFRPMTEMLPDSLQAQVQQELNLSETIEAQDVREIFVQRLLQRLVRENKDRPGAPATSTPAIQVDPLSLSSLLSHGFDEGPARRALRKTNNDTQAAMEWLLAGEPACRARTTEHRA
ncbi:unnamed protein product [Durusdinium trenchii]|uniref:UBA domain-containing protein n=1 Tax=Durusdinium trenchii TaxID=1381693 RepID=A0ABP0LAP0_9DINO